MGPQHWLLQVCISLKLGARKNILSDIQALHITLQHSVILLTVLRNISDFCQKKGANPVPLSKLQPPTADTSRV
jgi:hypothetical protein